MPNKNVPNKIFYKSFNMNGNINIPMFLEL